MGSDSPREHSKVTRRQEQAQHVIDMRVFALSLFAGMVLTFGAGIATQKPLFCNPIAKDATLANYSLSRNGPKEIYSRGKDEESHFVDRNMSSFWKSKKAEVSDAADNSGTSSGQHLLVDLKNVDGDFLNSEERIILAMIRIVNSANLKLLSHHCHKLTPEGLACVGALRASHISLHTWPSEGVIILDVFTSVQNMLFSLVEEVERFFGVPRYNVTAGSFDKVLVQSSHELRGFHFDSDTRGYRQDIPEDLWEWILSPIEMVKRERVYSSQTDHHRVDIWDALDDDEEDPSWEDALMYNFSLFDPRFDMIEFSTPERFLFLDLKLRSLNCTASEYYEALVHPAMFSHPQPDRVAVLGGGDGATLREILKHNTVHEVKLIEIDASLIEIAKEHLPLYSDCGDLVGSTKICFDDSRVDILHEDVENWFLTHYQEPSQDEKRFEVIVMDALDPDSPGYLGPSSLGLLGNVEFLYSVLNSLADDGVLVTSIGVAPTLHDPPSHKGVDAHRERIFQILEASPLVKKMLVYQESRTGFGDAQSFLVICKSESCLKHWHAEADAVDFQIYQRILSTYSKKRPLLHFDGSTQYSYQMPSKEWESLYCRRTPTPPECQYRGLSVSAELRTLGADGKEGDLRLGTLDSGEVGIFASVPIARGDYILPDSLASSFFLSENTRRNVKESLDKVTDKSPILDLLSFIDRNGHDSIARASEEIIVEVGESLLIRRAPTRRQANIGRMLQLQGRIPTFSPVYERYRKSFDVFLVATKDIAIGEELFKYDGIWD